MPGTTNAITGGSPFFHFPEQYVFTSKTDAVNASKAHA